MNCNSVIPNYLEILNSTGCLREQQQTMQNQHLLSLAHKLNSTAASSPQSNPSLYRQNALVDFGIQFQNNSQHLFNSLASLQPKSNLIELFQNLQNTAKAPSSALAEAKSLNSQQHKLAFNYSNYLNSLNVLNGNSSANNNSSNANLLHQLQMANNVLRLSQSSLAGFSMGVKQEANVAKGKDFLEAEFLSFEFFFFIYLFK